MRGLKNPRSQAIYGLELSHTTIASMMLNRNPLLALYYTNLLNAVWLISFQTVAEMRFGARKANRGTARQQQLEIFLQRFQIIPYTDPLATHWAEIRLDAEHVGLRLEAGDAWIAASARLLNAPLLTHDKDFSPAACPSLTVYCYGIP